MSNRLPTSGSLSTALALGERGICRESLSRGELLRKFLHISPGLMPFLFIAFPQSDPLEPASLWIVAAAAGVLTAVFLGCSRIVRRPDEDNLLSSATSYPAIVVMMLLLFPADSELACVVVLVLAFGDGGAFFWGRFWGGTPLPWNAEKTWMGSIGFVVCSAPLAAAAYYFQANPAASVLQAVICAAAAAFAGAAAESLPMKVTDNLRVGLAASVAAVLVHFGMRVLPV